MSKQPIITIKGVSKVFGDQIALDDIDLDIYPGEFFSLLGGSGSGKSTLLRLIAGFDQASQGRIIIDGQPMESTPPYARPINMMFQSYALFPHMSVMQNIAFGLRQEKLSSQEIKTRTEHMMEVVQLSDYAKRKPHQLSGGQRQRVALARCLAKRPKVLLLDEPLSALDKKLREKMQFELVDIQEQLGMTFIMVTHDQEEAMTMSSRMAVMNNGVIEQIGAPNELYEYPINRYTAEFIGSINLFESHVEKNSGDQVKLNSQDTRTQFILDRSIDCAVEQTVWLAIRPEKLLISKKPPSDFDARQPTNCIIGTVRDIAYLGGLSTYYIDLASGHSVKAIDFNIERDSDHPTWEDTVYLTWDSANMMVLLG